MNNSSDPVQQKNWWGSVWRGLVVDPGAQHYQKLGKAIWLYLYLLIHADRRTGRLMRRYETIATEMGIPARTVRQWMATLHQYGYLTRRSTGRALVIHITKWKPIVTRARVAKK